MNESVFHEILEELRAIRELLEDADAQLQSLPSGGGDQPPPPPPGGDD